MSAAANAAAFLFMRKDKRLGDWQMDVDLHRLAPSAPPLAARPAAPRITYRAPRVRRLAAATQKVSA